MTEVALSVISWGAEGVGFYLICRALQMKMSVSPGIGIYAIASLAGSAAFILPGGIGGMEIVMTTLLVAYGASPRTAVIATLMCRIATLWFAVLIGLAAAAATEFQSPRKWARSAA